MLNKSKNIQKFKDYPWILTFNHFLREKNNCANCFAKYGYKLDCCNVSWHGLNIQLHQLVMWWQMPCKLVSLVC